MKCLFDNNFFYNPKTQQCICICVIDDRPKLVLDGGGSASATPELDFE